MTEERLPLAELLAKAGDGDFLRSVAEAVMQLLMETDVEGMIGAGGVCREPTTTGVSAPAETTPWKRIARRLRIPTQTSQRFRSIPAGNSDGSQPLIPSHSSHPGKRRPTAAVLGIHRRAAVG